MLALALSLSLASSSALPLADVVTGPGCPLRLAGDAKHPFAEAQIACDAYVAFALVDELRAGVPASESDRARAAHVQALAALLDDALDRGQASFRKLPTVELAGTRVSTSVLGRGWLLVMMGGMATVDALPAERVALFDAIAASLVDDLARAEASGAWLASYPRGYWPCDHALAASGLALHGAARANAASTAAGAALAARLRALHAPRGYVTQVNAKGGVIEPLPRGTTLAWTASFLALGGHAAAARAFATTLARDFCAPLPFVAAARACREWPRGTDRAADAVSGPIVMGFGSGASALAIAAFRATGAEDDARALEALMPLAPAMALVPDVRATPAKYPLENAILAWGASAGPWL